MFYFIKKNIFRNDTNQLGTNIPDDRNEVLKNLAVQVTLDYLSDWFDNTWPNFLEMVYSKLMMQATRVEAGVEICRYCGNFWKDIGCPQHVFFECPNRDHVAFQSWMKFGPDTTANIPVQAHDWVIYVRQMGSNPFQICSETQLKFKHAYMGCLIEAYGNTELLNELQKSRHDIPSTTHGKDRLWNYKIVCGTHHNRAELQ